MLARLRFQLDLRYAVSIFFLPMLTHFKNLVPQGLKRGVRRALTIGRSAEVGMTSPAEQRWYCDIAAKRSQQNGAIVDLGSWMGATAIALSRGVRRSAHSWGIAPKPVYAFDRYIWDRVGVDAFCGRKRAGARDE